MVSSLCLTNFCILDKDARKCKFSFTLHGYSNVRDHRRSKPFRFGGQIWKLQVTKKKEHFGMFLRWYGTDSCLVQEELSLKCATTVEFSVLNKLYLDDSITEGDRNVVDIFEILRGGVGYSKVIRIDELENCPGYVVNDALYLQLRLKLVATSYSDKLLCKRPEGQDYIKGLEFPFRGTAWYVLFFPQGEPSMDLNSSSEDNIDEDCLVTQTKAKTVVISNSDGQAELSAEEEDGKEEAFDENPRSNTLSDKACIYLMRETDISRAVLRHNVHFMISVSGGNDFALEQHFYNEDSNIFGSASLMPVPKLKKISKSNKVQVTVTFKEIVPYFYFAYNIKHKNSKPCFDSGIVFKDQYCQPWLFEMTSDKSSQFVMVSLTLDPNKNNPLVKSYQEKKKTLQICWFADILSPVDIEKSLNFRSRGRRPLQEALFTKSGQRDTLVFDISLQQLIEEGNPYLDIDGRLCIRLSILECNFIVEDGVKSICVTGGVSSEDEDDLREVPIEKSLIETTNTMAQFDEKDVLIQSLIDHIDAYENYIKNLENDHAMALSIHEETSISKLITKCRPSLDDYENLASLAKTIEDIIKTLPVSTSKVFHAGALGQGTIVANHYQLDFIVFLEDYKEQKQRLKIVLNAVQQRILDYASKDPSDTSLERNRANTHLPFASHFYRTSKAIIFKLANVNVTIMLSKSLNHYGSYENMFFKAKNATKDSIHKYCAVASDRQVLFVEMQSELVRDRNAFKTQPNIFDGAFCENSERLKAVSYCPKNILIKEVQLVLNTPCKDLICVIKAWSDSVHWEDPDSRPSSYLLSLLLIHAYQSIDKTAVSRTPSFEKDVLIEFGVVVLEEDLSIEWSTFYDPNSYPLDESNSVFYCPLIRDPALPYHNVGFTGLKQWSQFREEVSKWVSSLVY